jgi:Uncharacterized protein conserved in bacteria
MHNTGIYSWDYLYELGEYKIRNIRAYLLALQLANKSRNPKLRKKSSPSSSSSSSSPSSSSSQS